GDGAVRRAEPGVRRHARVADRGDRHRTRCSPRTVRGGGKRSGLRVKALSLAAGYATRLRPLTDSWAKELLPVGGRPIVGRIPDSLAEVAEVDEVHLVTNARKAPWFHEWARGRDVTIHDDGTTSNDDRLGA